MMPWGCLASCALYIVPASRCMHCALFIVPASRCMHCALFIVPASRCMHCALFIVPASRCMHCALFIVPASRCMHCALFIVPTSRCMHCACVLVSVCMTSCTSAPSTGTPCSTSYVTCLYVDPTMLVICQDAVASSTVNLRPASAGAFRLLDGSSQGDPGLK
jgi:hypothetical protein